MPRKRKPSAAELDRQARTLTKYGFNISYRIGKTNTPQQRGAVRRLFNAHRYIYNRTETSPVKFVRYRNAHDKRCLRSVLSSEAWTPGGVFIQVPKGVRPSDYSYVCRDGVVVERIRGQQDDIIVPLDKTRILGATDSREVKDYLEGEFQKQHGKRKGRKLKSFRLMVGGNRGKRPYKIEKLGDYMRSIFAASVVEGRRGAMTAEDFQDRFQLELHYAPQKSTRRSSSKAGKKRKKKG